MRGIDAAKRFTQEVKDPNGYALILGEDISKKINRRNLWYESFWALSPDFFAWAIVWVAGEKILSAIWPEWFGAHQAAFQAAIEHGGQFTADATILLIHIVLGSIVSVMSGFLAALIAGENKRTPLILGVLLMAFSLLKLVLSWAYVPIWYHVIFTAILIPMTIMGGRLKTTA